MHLKLVNYTKQAMIVCRCIYRFGGVLQHCSLLWPYNELLQKVTLDSAISSPLELAIVCCPSQIHSPKVYYIHGDAFVITLTACVWDNTVIRVRSAKCCVSYRLGYSLEVMQQLWRQCLATGFGAVGKILAIMATDLQSPFWCKLQKQDSFEVWFPFRQLVFQGQLNNLLIRCRCGGLGLYCFKSEV